MDFFWAHLLIWGILIQAGCYIHPYRQVAFFTDIIFIPDKLSGQIFLLVD